MTRHQQNRFRSRFAHLTHTTAPSPPPPSQHVPVTSSTAGADSTQHRRQDATSFAPTERAVRRRKSGAVILDDVEAWHADHAKRITAQEAMEEKLDSQQVEARLPAWPQLAPKAEISDRDQAN